MKPARVTLLPSGLTNKEITAEVGLGPVWSMERIPLIAAGPPKPKFASDTPTIEPGVVFQCRGVHYRFSEPAPYSENPPKAAGIYAVLVPDENCRPKPLRVLFFGRTDDFSRCLTETHHQYRDWRRRARNRPLLVAVHTLPPALSEDQRRHLERGFIEAYRPICNQSW